MATYDITTPTFDFDVPGRLWPTSALAHPQFSRLFDEPLMKWASYLTATEDHGWYPREGLISRNGGMKKMVTLLDQARLLESLTILCNTAEREAMFEPLAQSIAGNVFKLWRGDGPGSFTLPGWFTPDGELLNYRNPERSTDDDGNPMIYCYEAEYTAVAYLKYATRFGRVPGENTSRDMLVFLKEHITPNGCLPMYLRRRNGEWLPAWVWEDGSVHDEPMDPYANRHPWTNPGPFVRDPERAMPANPDTTNWPVPVQPEYDPGRLHGVSRTVMYYATMMERSKVQVPDQLQIMNACVSLVRAEVPDDPAERVEDGVRYGHYPSKLPDGKIFPAGSIVGLVDGLLWFSLVAEWTPVNDWAFAQASRLAVRVAQAQCESGGWPWAG